MTFTCEMNVQTTKWISLQHMNWRLISGHVEDLETLNSSYLSSVISRKPILLAFQRWFFGINGKTMRSSEIRHLDDWFENGIDYRSWTQTSLKFAPSLVPPISPNYTPPRSHSIYIASCQTVFHWTGGKSWFVQVRWQLHLHFPKQNHQV